MGMAAEPAVECDGADLAPTFGEQLRGTPDSQSAHKSDNRRSEIAAEFPCDMCFVPPGGAGNPAERCRAAGIVMQGFPRLEKPWGHARRRVFVQFLPSERGNDLEQNALARQA